MNPPVLLWGDTNFIFTPKSLNPPIMDGEQLILICWCKSELTGPETFPKGLSLAIGARWWGRRESQFLAGKRQNLRDAELRFYKSSSDTNRFRVSKESRRGTKGACFHSERRCASSQSHACCVKSVTGCTCWRTDRRTGLCSLSQAARYFSEVYDTWSTPGVKGVVMNRDTSAAILCWSSPNHKKGSVILIFFFYLNQADEYLNLHQFDKNNLKQSKSS